jgi:L-fuconolactonase
VRRFAPIFSPISYSGATSTIERHPDTRFVIDHMAIQQPSAPPAPPEPWADLPKVLELAKSKNAVIKVSGACTLSEQPYPFPDIWDPLAHLLCFAFRPG